MTNLMEFENGEEANKIYNIIIKLLNNDGIENFENVGRFLLKSLITTGLFNRDKAYEYHAIKNDNEYTPLLRKLTELKYIFRPGFPYDMWFYSPGPKLISYLSRLAPNTTDVSHENLVKYVKELSKRVSNLEIKSLKKG